MGFAASPYRKKVLLLGGSWSSEMALEEEVIFFYERFLKEFKNDSRNKAIKALLVDLYLGRELYGEVSRIHKKAAEGDAFYKPGSSS